MRVQCGWDTVTNAGLMEKPVVKTTYTACKWKKKRRKERKVTGPGFWHQMDEKKK